MVAAEVEKSKKQTSRRVVVVVEANVMRCSIAKHACWLEGWQMARARPGMSSFIHVPTHATGGLLYRWQTVLSSQPASQSVSGSESCLMVSKASLELNNKRMVETGVRVLERGRVVVQGGPWKLGSKQPTRRCGGIGCGGHGWGWDG
ncbi:unnamed protein product [Periconia digitata]|uniref:Uncharacterized protein n=1 Tax=Periconia digitata TaxID=1303443 RepID=A0A9W4U345_9PLEO|nr:unnamed protein product [Periconia digitata]